MTGIAILGFGTVGSGVYEVIKANSEIIKKKTGEELFVKRVLDLRYFPGNPVEEILTDNFEDILNDSEIDVVTEVMGGIEPAFTFSKRAMQSGKSVVTSNKALVAQHGPELMKIAKENNVSYLFEASVGGTIPIIRPLMVCLTADEILEISGILNGTTNYILTKMTEEGKAFETVLETAQNLGYAEANPAADVEGHDACRKIAILSSIAFGKTADFEKIYTEGITKITAIDINYAKKIGCVIKLIGSSRKTEKGISARVCPCLIKDTHPLASVNDAYNAIFVKGNMSGNTMFYGSGAGQLPTASAVVADVIDAVKHKGETVEVTGWNYSENAVVEDISDCDVKALIRIAFTNEPEAKKAVGELFMDVEFISIGSDADEFAFITGNETEGILSEKLNKLKELSGIEEIRNLIRMEE